MSGLAALLAGHTPPDLYQWHNHAAVEDVQHAVEHAGWSFRHLDAWTVEEPDAFCKSVAAALDLPDPVDGGVAELAAAIGSLETGEPGTVFLWDGWSPLARHDQECFDAVMAALGQRARDTGQGKLAVILRGDGPPLELEELPIKH